MASETTHQAYFKTVHEIAAEAYVIAQEKDSEAAADYIWDVTVGSWWALHTPAAQDVLAHSPNADGAKAASRARAHLDDAQRYTRAAFYAMRADVEDRLAVLAARP